MTRKFCRFGLVITAAASLAAVTAPAKAQSVTDDWTVGSTGTVGPGGAIGTGSGTITFTSGGAGGADTVTGILGEIQGVSITGLATATGSPTVAASGDNLVYPNGSPTVLDLGGLIVTTASGNLKIWSSEAQGSTDVSDPNVIDFQGSSLGFGVGTFTLSPVPLPTSWIMMLTAILGVGLVSRRRERSAVASIGA
jgi:hypothetical protein